MKPRIFPVLLLAVMVPAISSAQQAFFSSSAYGEVETSVNSCGDVELNITLSNDDCAPTLISIEYFDASTTSWKTAAIEMEQLPIEQPIAIQDGCSIQNVTWTAGTDLGTGEAIEDVRLRAIAETLGETSVVGPVVIEELVTIDPVIAGANFVISDSVQSIDLPTPGAVLNLADLRVLAYSDGATAPLLFARFESASANLALTLAEDEGFYGPALIAGEDISTATWTLEQETCDAGTVLEIGSIAVRNLKPMANTIVAPLVVF